MKLELHDSTLECDFDIGQIVYADRGIGQIEKCKVEQVVFTVGSYGANLRYKVKPEVSCNKTFETNRVYGTAQEAFK